MMRLNLIDQLRELELKLPTQRQVLLLQILRALKLSLISPCLK
jgi:hypothetical protein